jgi:hypothetical protein
VKKLILVNVLLFIVCLGLVVGDVFLGGSSLQAQSLCPGNCGYCDGSCGHSEDGGWSCETPGWCQSGCDCVITGHDTCHCVG